MKIDVSGDSATLHGPFPFDFLNVIAGLRGKKEWTGTKILKVEASNTNITLLKASKFENMIEWSVTDNPLFDEPSLPTQHSPIPPLPTEYCPALSLFKHQQQCIALSWERKAYAYFLEMGLGKTAIMITVAGMLHLTGKLSGVLVLSPKGVHRQWLEEQIPLHIDPKLTVNCLLWKQKEIPTKLMNVKGLTFLSMNIDAIRTRIGYKVAENFLKIHNGKSMMIVDESHTIKSGKTERTRAAVRLGQWATYRRISTGTPISKNIIDAWSQFLFLNQAILGHSYMTSFRARYCVMGGWEGKQIVGQRNVEEFYSLIAPHSFRLTKAEALDLPPKIYAKREYEMGEKTHQHYESLKRTFMTELDDGQIVDVATAATALLRLQQIVCGYLPVPKEDEDAEPTIEVFSEERLDVMMDIVEQVAGPVIIWARFIADIQRISARLNEEFGNESAVTYYGATSNTMRKENVAAFLEGKSRFFVSNPAAGGTGLNLQGGCQTVIYYSNSFDALHRWQSEDRTHRMGMKGAVTYFDIVAQKTVDRVILGSLRAKKSISTMTLDQIRLAIAS